MHWRARVDRSVVLALTLLMTQTTDMFVFAGNNAAHSQVPFLVPQTGPRSSDLLSEKKLRWKQGRPTPWWAALAQQAQLHQPPGSTHFCKQKLGIGYIRYIY